MPDLSSVEFSPKMQEELQRQGIVFPHSYEEARKNPKINPVSAIHLDDLLTIWKGLTEPDWRILKGANVLDLACGSELDYEIPIDTKRTPWFARLAAVNGARVVGIDIKLASKIDRQIFETIQLDLVPIIAKGRLAELPQLRNKARGFDVIYSNAFVYNTPVGLDDQIRKVGIATKEFERKLIDQCSSLLAEGGVMFLGEIRGARTIYYKKINGEVITK